ncbi:tricarballylate utilization 4Fe-4S protein TcuB [Jiella endophytica]|uniref:Tricarballylate utilization 4Fe-4S protein TcuB n=2 Tax=Jiella endophytica TaxID=2558362 RepID=A0A4Y8RLP3_9HYPH|nr:tricarballylate utilization 4Fe-4S protein TcuB [Jiella endophytica]
MPLAEPAFDIFAEARRQVEICNACRYCEGYCQVFPAITRQTAFASGDLTQLANLCHNCRGCYYACQYTAPHEFALNLPGVLSDIRSDSWSRFAWPTGFAGLFQRSGAGIALALVVALALLFAAIAALPGEGAGFYAWLGHNAMVAIFAPAFLFPIAALAIGIRRYWREVGGKPVVWRDLADAGAAVAQLRNLSGGQGQGCNFEEEERYSDQRRWLHQAVMYGFLLCFLSTCSATLYHYLFDWSAPYPWWTLPKLLGVPGGILLVVGTAGLGWLKTRADPALGSPANWNGEMAFILLLGLTGLTGLVLYAVTGTAAVGSILALHLGCVLALFLLTPYSKMAHGFYRMAALVRDAQVKSGRVPASSGQARR